MAMGVESLVGSSAYLAKQLELRWFYHWEPAPCNESVVSMAPREVGDGATWRSIPDDAPANREKRTCAAGLRRKRRHSMPFLLRNMAGRRIGYWHRHDSRRLPSVKSGDTGGAAPSAEGVAVGTSRKKGYEAAPLPRKGRGKRKRAGGESDDYEGTKGLPLGRDIRTTTSTTTPNHLQFKQWRNSELSFSSAEFQSYVQSPTVRRRILANIPAELHHDETFVLERTKEAWLENEARDGGRGRFQYSDNDNEIDETESLRNNASAEKGHTRKPTKDPSCGNSSKYNSEHEYGIQDHVMVSLNAMLPCVARDTKIGSATLRNPQSLPPAYFHYVYMQPNNIPATLVEELEGRACPLCRFNSKSNDDLLEHCVRCHGMSKGRDFEAALGEEGQLHVILRSLPILLDGLSNIPEKFVFVKARSLAPGGRASTLIHRPTTIPFLRRDPHTLASLEAAARNKKLLSLQANDAPASSITPYLPNDTYPLRQYFHSRTNLPMAPGEWMEDSDDDTDNSWLREMSAELLDELEDVSPKEKRFMKMWNQFIKCDHVIADRDVPKKCHDFVVEHREELRDGGLRLNLLLHLFNLWDSGVVSSNRILSCMSLFDAV